MNYRALVLSLLCCIVASRSIPDEPVYVEGFKPVQGARGPTASSSNKVNTRAAVPPSFGGHDTSFTSGFVDSDFGGHGFGGSQSVHGGSVAHETLGEPDKTIYVRLPQSNKGVVHQAPKSAGPPQKHYRIVIIKSPTPPPVQPVLPPRSEQKTIIYVLHQKPKVTAPQVLEAPVKKHPPQVLFVGYDDELTANDLKQLAEGNHEGFSVTSQQDPLLGGSPVHASEGFAGDNFGTFHGGNSFTSGGVGGFSYDSHRRRSDTVSPNQS